MSTFDPALDLVVARDVRASPETIWTAWTRPEHLSQWYAPSPGRIADCEIDLRPGGILRFVPQTAEGEAHEILCCYLEIEPYRRLVWTDALRPGYRPATTGFFTAVMTLEPLGARTRCTTVAMHRDEQGRDRHAQMGFHDGWGTVLDQLTTYAPTIVPVDPPGGRS